MQSPTTFLAVFVGLAVVPCGQAAEIEAAYAANAPNLATDADGTADLQRFIQCRLDVGAKKIVVPPGRYRVAPHDKVHLRLRNLEDVDLVMRGVEIICTETTQALSITKCKRTRISGLTIDYDPLPFTQGRITAVGPKKECEVDPICWTVGGPV